MGGVRNILKKKVVCEHPVLLKLEQDTSPLLRVFFRKKQQTGSQGPAGGSLPFPHEVSQVGDDQDTGSRTPFLEPCFIAPKGHLRRRQPHQWPVSWPNLRFLPCRGALEKATGTPPETHSWILPGRKTLHLEMSTEEPPGHAGGVGRGPGHAWSLSSMWLSTEPSPGLI